MAYAWGTVAPALAGTGIGIGLTESGLLGGWVNKANETNTDTFAAYKNQCKNMADAAISAATSATDNNFSSANSYLSAAKTACDKVQEYSVITCEPYSEQSKKEDIIAKANVYRTACVNAEYYEKKSDKNGKLKKDDKNMAARVLIPLTTGIAAGGLGAGITASVLKANKENIKNEAAQQWMDEIGEHIQCYIGTEELGTYGDVVSIELD